MTFTVATIAREPWPILDRFLRWHLGQGAERIILFLDDPDDAALPRLKGEPRIDARPCTPAFWSGLGIGPGTRFTRRQRHVLAQAYADTPAGWLLVLDADELMWMPGRTLPDGLATLPDDALSLRVLSAEQVLLPGDGNRDGTSSGTAPGPAPASDPTPAFRTPIARGIVNRIYGPDADLLRIRKGLVYHPEGKSFHRAGQQGLTMKLHWALDAEGNRNPGPVWGPRDGAHLLHYAAPDYDRWRAKVGWRRGAHGFSQPVKDRLDAIAAGPDPEAGYRALFDTLHRLTAERATALEHAGGLLRHGPGI